LINTKWIDAHKGMSKQSLKLSFQNNCEYTLAKDQYTATMYDSYQALSLAIRDRIVERWIKTQQRYHKENVRRVYYLSMEFLIGRLLGNCVYNLGIEKPVAAAMEEMGFDLEEIREQETDAGLGNGGLGRLAACFLDSMATLGIPAHGYGIRYDYGIFNQRIINGYQVELPDEWLRHGTPWEFARPEYGVKVKFYGHIRMSPDENGNSIPQWVDTEDVLAVPYDMPVLGYKNDVVNTLRLWSARSSEEFDFEYFNDGDYEKAVYKKILSENISKVLYPNDSQSQGRELRLRQEYFFTAASVADILRRFHAENAKIKDLPKKICIQLNDTHPALAVVELMRVLLDKYRLSWEEAWEVTRDSFAYTNHTLMPEALESWSVGLLEKVLPRHLQIIYELNSRFLREVEGKYPGNHAKISSMSLIEEGPNKRARMANLAIIGSSSVNGVSALHSELLKRNLFRDFHEFYPGKFNSKTNGITQRRWLLKANPRLSSLITRSIGESWVSHLEHLEGLLELKDKKAFRAQWQKVKNENKKDLAEYINDKCQIRVNPDSIFDVQVKRMHEYKRQLLFTFYMIAEYLKIKNEPGRFVQPRTFIVGGKAAPGYAMAKLIIKFINSVADVVNADEKVGDRMKIVFLENYRVSLAEKIFPAAELSEQISTAGTEASGTGNMKFMLNGALTVGTYDGANIEIAGQAGRDNVYIFGLNEQEVTDLRDQGYAPMQFVHRSPVLAEIHNLVRNNFFSGEHPGLFDQILHNVFHNDVYMICADFDSYCQIQDQISRDYKDQKDEWTKKSIINVAKSGYFSSDRAILEYARDIWKIPVKQ
jgi:starch phosphorylase